MDILFVLVEHTISNKIYYAVVPSDSLEGVDLDEINGMTDNMEDTELSDQVAMLFDRFGLIPFCSQEYCDAFWKTHEEGDKFIYPPFSSSQDLKLFLIMDFPVTIDKIVSISSIA